MKHAPEFLKLVSDAKTRVRETDVQEVKSRLDAGEKFMLVDVREDGEWAKGRLPSAIHMGKGVIERDIENKIPQDDAHRALLRGRISSALAADNLQKMGYTNVTPWTAAGAAGTMRDFPR